MIAEQTAREEMEQDRADWLADMGFKESEVHEDRDTGLEFVFVGGEVLTRVFLPFVLQSRNINQFQ